MKFSAVFALTALSQFQGNVQAACGAKTIIDRCVLDQTNVLNNCNPSDNECLCNGHNAVAACYQNCPDDEYMNGQAALRKSQITIYCNAASQTQSSSGASSASASNGSSAPKASGQSNSKGSSSGNSRVASSDALPSHSMSAIFAAVLGAASLL